MVIGLSASQPNPSQPTSVYCAHRILSGTTRHEARAAASAVSERALGERIEQRGAKDALELEAAIRAINEGTWPEEEIDASK